jgi:diguanylate cyclase
VDKDKAKYASLFTSCLTAIALYSIYSSLNWMIPTAVGIFVYFMLYYKAKYNQCQRQLRNEEIHYRNLLNLSPNAIFVLKDGAVSYANRRTLQILQITMDDVVGKKVIDFIHPDYRKELIRYYNVPTRKSNELFMEAKLLQKGGQEITVEITLTPITHHREPAILGVFQDVSERKQYEEKIKFLAYYDKLTGLPNRFLFNANLKQAIHHLTEITSNNDTAVFFIDLDRFKFINDTLGHSVGDDLLRAVAGRLSQVIAPHETVARLGGDEFAMILPNVTKEQATSVARSILQTLSTPLRFGGHEVYITPSIGISFCPTDGKDIETLMKRADKAMYKAKEFGKNNFQFYSSSLSDVSSKKMELEMMLRGAIEREEFIIHYQPLVTIDSGQLTGMEALIRWKHPVRGIISPAEFIPLAEETGLIVPIGEWVLKKALSQMKIWKDQGYTSLRLAVNVSPHQIKYGDLPKMIDTLLKESAFEPQKLELEITESIFMQSTEEVMSVLHELKRLGVNISIDDFGIGFSSLGYLKSFPIDHLKIDQTFVKDCMNFKDQAIISTIISLAKQLNLNVIAEGVESDLQFTFLKEKLCNEAQGYLFSKPLSPSDFEQTFLKNQNILM